MPTQEASIVWYLHWLTSCKHEINVILTQSAEASRSHPDAPEANSHEVAKLTIQIISPESVESPSHIPHREGETTADQFFREKGAVAPALAFLGLIDHAVTAFNPVSLTICNQNRKPAHRSDLKREMPFCL